MSDIGSSKGWEEMCQILVLQRGGRGGKNFWVYIWVGGAVVMTIYGS